MRIDVEKVLPDDLMDDAWQFYADAFDELRIRAVQRHVMSRAEFEDVMTDDRVAKYVGRDGQHISALATLTNDLDAVPLISPEYFAHRWPDLYAQRRIFYVGFLALHADRRGAWRFLKLTRDIHDALAAAKGVVAVDICAWNEETLSMPQALRTSLARYAGDVTLHRLDAQTYWLYELPAAT